MLGLQDFKELTITNEPDDELGSNLDEDLVAIRKLEDIQKFMPVQTSIEQIPVDSADMMDVSGVNDNKPIELPPEFVEMQDTRQRIEKNNQFYEKSRP